MRYCFLLVVVLFCLVRCSQPVKQPGVADYFGNQDSGVQSGNVRMVEISTPKGKFHVWTKRFGSNPRIKVLLLHGGPGATHEYFECYENFLPKEGIEFIYYDQLDSYYSDKPNDSGLWTTEHFVEEVEQVRQALGLNKDNFYLLGHSWGGRGRWADHFQYDGQHAGIRAVQWSVAEQDAEIAGGQSGRL